MRFSVFKNFLKTFAIPCAVAFCVACLAFCMRRIYFFVQMEQAGIRPFFSLESAMLFRYVKMVFDSGSVPGIDRFLQYPEGAQVARVFSLWGLYLYAWFMKALCVVVKTDTVGLARIVVPLWFSAGCLFVFGALRRCVKGLFAPFAGALFYALAVSAVVRSTGMEISNENTALPFVCMHIMALCVYFSKPSWWSGVAAGVGLALGVCCWDLVQLFVGLEFLFFTLCAFRANADARRHIAGFLLALMCCMWIVCSRSVYLAGHGFLFSFPFVLGILCCVLHVWKSRGAKVGLAAGVLSVGGFVGANVLWGGSSLFEYAANYSHFSELLKYKLKFFNIRPEDPAKLPFMVRLLWTPALHSTTWESFKTYAGLPFLLCGGVFFGAGWFRFGRYSNTSDLPRGFFWFGWWVSLFLFILFFRLHVYFALFSALCVGIVLSVGTEAGRWKKAALWGLGGLFLGAVLANGFVQASKWGRSVYYAEIASLCKWIGTNTPPDSVFACNFGLSPVVVAYAQRPVVAHPKFELPDMRKRVKNYILSLFSENEEDFYGFCVENDVDYYVHSRGTWSDTSPFSWRYISNTISDSPEQNLTCSKFERRWSDLNHFFPVYSSGKYEIFRIISPELLKKFKDLTRQGTQFLNEGDFKEAVRCFSAAERLYPFDPATYMGLARAFNSMGQTQRGTACARHALELMVKGRKKTQKGTR